MSVDTGVDKLEGAGQHRAPLGIAVRGAARRPEVLASTAWLLAVIVCSTFASKLAPYGPLQQDLAHMLAGPSSQHWLGTDDVGRDILSRLLYGGGGLLWASAESVVIAVVIGVAAGMIAGYSGGWRDESLSFGMNVLMAIPGFVILIAVDVASGNDLVVVMAVLGLLFSINFFRIARAATLTTRELGYVEAARVAGLPTPRVLVRHVLPNITGVLVVQAFLSFGVALVIAASLAFLGLGFSPETPNWGQIVYDATQNLSLDPWMMVPIGVVLVATIASANIIGSALRDELPQAQRQALLMPTRRRRKAHAEATAAPVTNEAGSGGVTEAHAADREAPLLDVKRATVTFPIGEQRWPVVEDVSLTLRRGETLALVGESGCGKSVTALALIGLITPPGRVERGQILLDGRDLATLPEARRVKTRGSKIGLVSQEPMVALDPCFTVGSLLREALRQHHHLRRKEANVGAEELLKMVGIPDPARVAASYPHQISGGMAQRVAIALALSGEPDVLIADEPTTALDVTIQAEILDELRSLRERLGMAVLLVTHDFGVVAESSDRVAVMYAGQIVESGTTAEVLAHPSHPYTRALLAGATDRVAPGTPLPSVKGRVPTPDMWPRWCRFADRCELCTSCCRADPITLDLVAEDHAARCIRASEVLLETAQ